MAPRPETRPETWREVGEGVYVRRHVSLDLNVGLVVGDGRALVIDTRESGYDGRELLDAVRTVTAAPLVVVDTHPHWDHFLGNVAFRPAPVWALARCAAVISADGEEQRRRMAAAMDAHDLPDAAARIAGTEIVVPDHTFEREHVLDVGGREVRLAYLGRGHTDADVTLLVPDAGVLFAGDLVEEGAPPSYSDAFPLDWPATAAAVAELAGRAGATRVVPGHGDVVDEAYVRAQQADLSALADLARRAHAAGEPAESVVAAAPFGEAMSRVALQRAYEQLDGRL